MNTTAPQETMAATPVTPAGLARVGLHVLLAALPLLAISAHVFGLITMNWSAALLVIPLATSIVALSLFAPHPEDRVILHGFVWGIIGCALYDVFRLDTVYMLGWWADFIPTMGTWIVGDASSRTAGAWVGYLWRYLGDGGGIGVTFFVGAAFLGLHHRPARQVVAASVAFAVFPVWAGLIATVWLAPRGQTMMFPLTPVTLTLSLIGHLIFGLIMGLGFVRTRSAHRFWPWKPVVDWFATPGPALEAPAEPTVRVARRPSRPAARASAPPAHPVTSERPVVVPPPPLPAGHPSAPFPRQHPSGSLPVPRTGSQPAVTRTGSQPVVAPTGSQPAMTRTGSQPAVTRTGSQPAVTRTGSQPVTAPATGSQPVSAPRTGSQPVSAPRTGSHAVASTSTGSTSTGSTSTGSMRTGSTSTGSHRTATRTEASARPSTPAEGTTLDPETWALWQRQLATTVKGRRTHRWR